jgi:hypothetical protein
VLIILFSSIALKCDSKMGKSYFSKSVNFLHFTLTPFPGLSLPTSLAGHEGDIKKSVILEKIFQIL